MRGLKHGHKRGVNRHTMQARASADRQERSIERTNRQAGQRVIAAEVIRVAMEAGSAVERHCAFIIAQCKRQGEPVPEYVAKALAMEEKKKKALKEMTSGR
jgi:hypothetical protein